VRQPKSSRFLGVTEDTGRYLHTALADLGDTAGWDDEQSDVAATSLLQTARASDARRSPGSATPSTRKGTRAHP
jgi:citrate synthase